MFGRRFSPAIWLVAFSVMAQNGARAEDTLIFIHTAGLSETVTGMSDDPLAPTFSEARSTLLKLKQKYPESLWVDSGGIHGPKCMAETMFTLPMQKLFDELPPFAVNYGSHDMLYSQAHYQPLYNHSLKKASLTSTAQFPHALPDGALAPKLEKKAGALSTRVVGLGDIARATPLLEGYGRYMNDEKVTETAVQSLTGPQASPVDLNIALTTLHPSENESLAKKLPKNTLIFEQTLHGVDPGPPLPPVREVNGVSIVSKNNWWTADVVQVKLNRDRTVASSVIERVPFNPWFHTSPPGMFKRLFGAKAPPPPQPGRKRQGELPDIGPRFSNYGMFRRHHPGVDEILEFRLRGASGAESRRNDNVYYYRLMQSGEPIGDFIQVRRSLVSGMASIIVYLGFNPDGRITHFNTQYVVRMNYSRSMLYTKYKDRFLGKTADEIEIKPSEMFGLEYHGQYLVKDVREACRIYLLASRKAKQISDPMDWEDIVSK